MLYFFYMFCHNESILIRKWGECFCVIFFLIHSLSLSLTHSLTRPQQNYLSGLIMARFRSRAIAVSVNTETFTLTVWTNGQKAHINSGKFHRWSSAAWNCNSNWEKGERKRENIIKRNKSKLQEENKNDNKTKWKRLEIMKQPMHLFESFLSL